MYRKVHFNLPECQRMYNDMLFALLDGLAKAQGVKGEVMIKDVHNASILTHVALHEASVLNDMAAKDKKGKYGDYVFIVNRVTKEEFVRIEMQESQRYVEEKKSTISQLRLSCQQYHI